MIAGGLGAAGWYGLELYQLPERTPAQVNEIVELRLASELEHMGPLLRPSGERLERLQQMIRTEVKAEGAIARKTPERWIGVGLVVAVFGAGSWVLSLGRRRN